MKISSKLTKQFANSSKSYQRIAVITSESALKDKKAFKNLGSVATAIDSRLKTLLKKPKAGEVFNVQAGDQDIAVALLPKETHTFGLLGFAKSVIAASVITEVESLAIVCLEADQEEALADVFTAAVCARVFLMPTYGKRNKDLKPYKLASVDFYGSKDRSKIISRSQAITDGTNLVRSLGTLPPNELHTGSYGAKIKELCAKNKITVKFYSNKELKKMGAGAFTAVDQANPESQGGIYELTYSPKTAKNKKPVVLVGKGLCYDTGGYDVKTNGYMVGMKGDMSGSALAMANLIVAAQLKVPLKMKAFLGVTENHISPRGYKPDDVVTALNGMTIEVINTDAEGRMVLADTLCLASRAKPELIIDYATLTGCAVVAIGNSYAAAFSNRDELHSKIIKAGRESGERVWTFPMDKDYGKALESQVADIIQCVKARSPDHIMAAYFLSQFVEKDIDWVHVDLAAADRPGGLAHIDSEFTGFGVRWTWEFLSSQYKLA